MLSQKELEEAKKTATKNFERTPDEELLESALDGMMKRKPSDLVEYGYEFLDEKLIGIFKGDLVIVGGETGIGKGVADNSSVLTPFGWKKGKDLEEGDIINSVDGGTQKIIHIHPRYTLEKWTVVFEDGTEIPVNEEHVWKAWYAHKRKKGKYLLRNSKKTCFCGEDAAEIVKTKTLKKWLDDGRTPLIPLCKPQISNSNTELKIEPYLLGFLLADGCITTSSITASTGTEDIDFYRNKLGKENITYRHIKSESGESYSISFIGDKRKKLVEGLKFYNLLVKRSVNKFVPEVYKLSTIEDRRKILNGLMDADGYMPQKNNACFYNSASKQLAEDVAYLVRSLCGYAKITKKKAGYKDKNGKYVKCLSSYEVYIKANKGFFSIPRKNKKICGNIKAIDSKRVVDVRVGGTVTGRCITVSSLDGLYVTDNFVVTHNSSWLKHVARSVASTGRKVGYYLLEDTPIQTRQNDLYLAINRARHIEGKKGFSYRDYMRGTIAKKDLEYWGNRVADDEKDIRTNLEWITGVSDIDIKKMIEELEASVGKDGKKYDLIVIDHLHYLALEGGESMQLTIQKFMRRLSTTVKNNGLRIILAAHYKKLNGDQPTDESFKDAQAIAQNATVTIHISRDRKTKDEDDEELSDSEIDWSEDTVRTKSGEVIEVPAEFKDDENTTTFYIQKTRNLFGSGHIKAVFEPLVGNYVGYSNWQKGGIPDNSKNDKEVVVKEEKVEKYGKQEVLIAEKVSKK